MYFNNLKVSTKLSLLILVAFVSLLVVGGVGYYDLQESSKQVVIMYEERLIPIDHVSNIQQQMEANRSTLLEMALTTDMNKKQELKILVGERKRIANESMEVLRKLQMDPKGLELMAKITEAQNKYRPVRDEIVEMLMVNKNAEAFVAFSTRLPEVNSEYIKQINLLDKHYTSLAKQAREDSQKSAKHDSEIILGIIIAAFAALSFSGWIITRMITRPLQI
jgi:methyl-accepting chemotaxis protein